MDRNEAEKKIADILENSGLTFGEVINVLNRLTAIYHDKGKKHLQNVQMQVVAKEKRFN